MNKENLRLSLIIALFGLPLMGLGIWWGLFPAALLASLLLRVKDRKEAAITGVATGAFIWFMWSIIAYFDGGQIIAQRFSGVFGAHWIILFLAASIIGGLMSMLGAVAGTIDLQMFRRKEEA